MTVHLHAPICSFSDDFCHVNCQVNQWQIINQLTTVRIGWTRCLFYLFRYELIGRAERWQMFTARRRSQRDSSLWQWAKVASRYSSNADPRNTTLRGTTAAVAASWRLFTGYSPPGACQCWFSSIRAGFSNSHCGWNPQKWRFNNWGYLHQWENAFQSNTLNCYVFGCFSWYLFGFEIYFVND